jgi:hypothetical protein
MNEGTNLGRSIFTGFGMRLKNEKARPSRFCFT